VGDYEIVIEQHDAILKAVEEHNGEKAQFALREHLESVGKRLTVALLEGRSKSGIDADSPALDPHEPPTSL